MNYEIVNLEEKIVVGISAIISNDDPNMGKVIGGLWGKLYEDGINETIKNKVNEYAIGLYSDYENNKYTVTVGNEVCKAENEEITIKKIPSGKYAKFFIEGNMQKVVAEACNEICQMDLDRSYEADFEEYLNADFDNAKINIYISLK
ncbi:putative transcriptional regulator YdeE [Clostridium moniliforme]|uniref:Transcriptional regulator YdeE n=1 Tax=Clostridium moniliforme TaxID=39489 RepID=A0ABS4EX80_9CLOT|nr:GyrI-like domain-containing protein [Clostridium moniliforme]MBP1888615.1 putative transcriptional regulator YdeE [Clostridium moniliforme]